MASRMGSITDMYVLAMKLIDCCVVDTIPGVNFSKNLGNCK
jgi:hypothetical protein